MLTKQSSNVWYSEAILNDAYAKFRNFEVEDIRCDSKICIVFFSSNGLYDHEDKEDFHQKILVENRFEWKSIARSVIIREHVGRVIYVRDIYKQWYVMGINPDIDTIDKLKSLLLTLTKGYDVITVGSSAGGYAAVLLGLLIGAKHCLSFCGQFSLHYEAEKREPLVERYVNDAQRNKYYDLAKFVSSGDHRNTETGIYYFYPKRSQYDIVQYEKIKDIDRIRIFTFDEDEHSVTVVANSFPYLIMLSQTSLDALHRHYKGKLINRFGFLFRTVGCLKGIGILAGLFLKKAMVAIRLRNDERGE